MKYLLALIMSVVTFGMAVLLWVSFGQQQTVLNVTTFEECSNVTGIVMESYPRQCVYQGRTFPEVLRDNPIVEQAGDDNNNNSNSINIPKGVTKSCVVGGCSNQICDEASGDDGLISTCEWKAEYACYANAACERQTDGVCGWTMTSEMSECLASPPDTFNENLSKVENKDVIVYNEK